MSKENASPQRTGSANRLATPEGVPDLTAVLLAMSGELPSIWDITRDVCERHNIVEMC